MKNRLLWKLTINILPVIGVTSLVIWLTIDQLAASYFMHLMEKYAIAPLDTNRMFLEAVHRYLLWSTLAALILALGLNYLLTKRVLRPLAQMTRISEEMAGGQFNNRVEVVSSDEIGRLGLAFNRMADSLAHLEKMRKSMVTDVAHELRTPLTNLRGYLEGLSDEVLPPSPETFRMLESETLRLVHLVDDLQQLTKAESAKAFLKKQELSLEGLMVQVLDLFNLRFQAKKLQVRIQIEPLDLKIYADLDKLLQALRNLLENAWRYSPEGGQVEISAVQNARGVKLVISNSGPGISSEDLPFIFERFFRADRSRSREMGGAGIGLSIVKELIEAHGGQVGAESGKGMTSVWLQLPT